MVTPIRAETSIGPLDGTVVKIGYIASSTTGLVTAQPFIKQIIEPDLNDYARKLGYDVTFEFLIEDSASLNNVHLEKVQAFHAMGVNLIIGGLWSSQAAGSLGYCNENNILLFSSSSTSPLLAIPNDNLYRMCPTDLVQGPAIAEMLWSYGIKAVVVIQRGDIWADSIYNGLKPEFERRGGVILEKIRYAAEETEFSNYLQFAENILATAKETYGADRIAVEMISFQEGVTIVTQAKNYPTLYNVPWFGSDGTAFNQQFIDDAPTQAAHLGIYSTIATVPQSQKYSDLYDRYYAITNQPLGFYNAGLYDIAWVIAKGVLEAQSTQAHDVIPLIPQICYDMWGASGWCRLDQNGDRYYANYDIWGYGGTPVQNVHYGYYDSVTGKVIWDTAALGLVGSFGFTAPLPPKIIAKSGSFTTTVTALDASGNPLTTYTGANAVFTSTDPDAVITKTWANGVATLGVTLKTYGTHTITVTDGLVSKTSASIIVGVEYKSTTVPVNVGDTLPFAAVVPESLITRGGKLLIYWDAVRDWDASTGTGLIAETYATTGQTFKVSITIPASIAGPHYLIVKDYDTAKVLIDTIVTVVPKIAQGITVSTNKTSYLPNELVTISGVAQANAWVSIDVKNPLASSIYIDTVQASGAGAYITHFMLPSTASTGTYTVYVSAPSATAQTPFTVGVPVGPELPAETTNQKAKDSTGAPKTSFALGETVLASAEVANTGTVSQAMLIVVQWKDPDLRVMAPVFISVTLAPGQSFEYAPGLTLPLTGYTKGTWTARIMVFSAWPAQGGVTIGAPVTITITVS